MVTFSRSNGSARIQQILRTTAKHFSLHVPETQLRLDRGEFVDPLPLRWSNVPRQITHTRDQLTVCVPRSTVRWMG